MYISLSIYIYIHINCYLTESRLAFDRGLRSSQSRRLPMGGPKRGPKRGSRFMLHIHIYIYIYREREIDI